MAVQTIYLLGTAGVTPNFWGNTQLNGTAPTAANSAFGWGPAKTAVTTPYYRGRIGATTTGSDAAVASSTISGLTAPRAGTGTGAATASDSFVVGPLNGTFAASVWTFNFNLRAGTAGAIGHINLIGYKSANANGSGATTLISFRSGATVTLSTTADVNSSVGYTPGTPVVFNNEYLFIQLEWQETTAGSSNSDNVFFRIGTSSITTSDFVPVITGTLALTELPDTLTNATGNVNPVRGALSLTEQPDTLSATGTVITGTALPPITGDLGGAADPNTVLLIHADGANGSTSFIDSSSYAHTLTASNGAAISTANPKFGTGAIDLTTSSSAVIDTGNISDFALGNQPFTIEAWCYFQSDTNDFHIIACQWQNSPPNYSWLFGWDTNATLTFYFTTNNSDYTPLTANYTPPLNTWVHIAFDRDATDTYRMYADGVVILGPGSLAGKTFLTPTSNCAIGNELVGTYDVHGFLDEVRISKGVARYGGAFTPPTSPFTNPGAGGITQAAQTLSATGTVVAPLPPITGALGGAADLNTVLLMHCDGTNGSTSFTDSSFYAHTLTAAGAAQITTAQEKFGTGSANFSTSSASGINTGNATDFNFGSGQFTIEAWTYLPSALGGGVPLISQMSSSLSNIGWVLSLSSTTLGFSYSTSGLNILTINGSYSPPIGPWIHIAVDRDGSNVIRVYADGVVIGSGTVGSTFYASTRNAIVGNYASLDAAYPGYIDEVRVTKGLARYGGPFTPPTQAFTALTVGLTQADQTLSATGNVVDAGGPNTGTLAVTQQSQTISAQGRVLVAGTLAVTQAPQTISAAGGVLATGTLAVTQANQTIVAAGRVLATGTLAQTQASQTIAAQGAVRVGATLAVTQDSQSLAAQGGTGVTGTLAQAQQSQTISAQGRVPVTGTLVQAQADQTLAAAGRVSITATLAVTQDPQTISATGSVVSPGINNGTLNQTQQPQTLAAAGRVAITASLAATEALDGLAATGGVLVTATLSQAQASQTILATGAVRISATLAQTQQPQTLAATGMVPAFATPAAVQDPQTLRATGTVATGIAGGLAVTQDPQALVATGAVSVSATLAVSEALDTLAGLGGPTVGATLNAPQDPQGLAATGRVSVAAVLAAVQDSQIILARGSVIVTGALDVTEADDRMAGSGTSGIVLHARVLVMA